MPEPVTYAFGKGRGFLEIAIALELSRQLSYEQIARAVKGLVSSFPILACAYRPGFWRDRWIPLAEFPIEKVVFVEEVGADLSEREIFYLSRFFDPEKEWPFRIVCLNHDQGCRLLLIYPHLIGDANAGLSIIWALGKFLHNQPLPENLPMNRSIGQLARALGIRSIPTLAGELLRELSKVVYLPFLGRWDREFSYALDLSGRMNYSRISVTGPLFQQFISTCKRHNATINDGLVAISAMVALKRAKSRFSGTIYTVNLRRFLKNPGPIIANLSGVNTLPVSAKSANTIEQLIQAVALRTQEHKRRLPGIAFNLLPMIFVGWLPFGPIHLFGRKVFNQLVSRSVKRLAVFTNVGSMDEYLEPFKAEVVDAWMMGTFQRQFPAPVAMASGFRDGVSVCLSAADDLTKESVDKLAEDWNGILDQFG